jgi:hypothetical protein
MIMSDGQMNLLEIKKELKDFKKKKKFITKNHLKIK